MDNNTNATPVVPLPNPGEGGPVYDDSRNGATPVIPLPNVGEGGPVNNDTSSGAMPVIPLPNPGEGGPVNSGSTSGGAIPVIPLPNPGEGGPVGGGGIAIPVWPRYATTRFLNAAFGYQTFRILINNRRTVSWLNYGSLSSYSRVATGYQTITVTGTNGYIYLQKTMPFQTGTPTTIAIINTASGLDLLQITDNCCPPAAGYANFRVCNLARNSNPLDVILADGRTVYSDVHFKEATAFKRIQPGAYEFLFAETDQTPMPVWLDIETLDSAFIGTYPVPNMVASLYINIVSGVNYTVYLLSSGSAVNAVQTMVSADR